MLMVKAQHNISLTRQTEFNRIARSGVYRRRARQQRNEPLLKKPGPRKIEFDHEQLLGKIRQLPSGPKRTVGLGRLHASWNQYISRRDIRELAFLVRWEAREEKLANMRRIDWLEPGTVWAFDDTHIGYEYGHKLFNTTGIDLGSKYLFEPLTGTPCCSAEIAGHLDSLCGRYGPPLFLKRDNGSNLNGLEVEEVMQSYGIIALNSPPYYPPYNGTIEHMNGELKDMIDADASFQQLPTEHKEAYLASYIHTLNHNERRCLNTRHACMRFGNRRLRATFYKRMRRDIIGEVQIIQEEILSEIHDPDNRQWHAARRRACEQVMWKHQLININNSEYPLSLEIAQTMPDDQSVGPNVRRAKGPMADQGGQQ